MLRINLEQLEERRVNKVLVQSLTKHLSHKEDIAITRWDQVES